MVVLVLPIGFEARTPMCPEGFQVARTILHCGCPISYDSRGGGPPVLMIQGVGVHGDGWNPQVERLGSDFTCLTFDNRGMGRSIPAGGPITVGQMADDARALLDAEGWASAHVVGHSLGGLASISTAGFSAPVSVPANSKTPCFQGFPRIQC
jgi:hypothetical protein